MDNKLRGAYAESDLSKGTIRVNVKRHTQSGYKRINPTKEGNENLGSTIFHEKLHFKHPKATEKSIRKMEKKGYKKLSPKRKKQLLATQITRKVTISAAPASTAKAAAANVQVLTHLVDGREEVETVLTINPV